MARTPNNATENKRPEESGALIAEAALDPLANFQQLAEASGMSPGVIAGILKRMRARHPSAMAELEGLSHGDLVRALDKKIAMALHYMDDFAFSQASLRDLNIALGIMIEKKQLLLGEPTAILSVQERRTINELLPRVLKEAARRGLTIDVTPDEPARVIPPETIHKQALSVTARKFPDEPIEVSFE